MPTNPSSPKFRWAGDANEYQRLPQFERGQDANFTPFYQTWNDQVMVSWPSDIKFFLTPIYPKLNDQMMSPCSISLQPTQDWVSIRCHGVPTPLGWPQSTHDQMMMYARISMLHRKRNRETLNSSYCLNLKARHGIVGLLLDEYSEQCPRLEHWLKMDTTARWWICHRCLRVYQSCNRIVTALTWRFRRSKVRHRGWHD